MKNKISTTIITFNEEESIEKCLKSVEKFSDEIIIVDSGSTDRTVKIAKRFTNKIYTRKFDNYANQKNFAASKANNDFVFSIDADETASDELINEIKNLDFTYAAYSIPRKNYILGKFIKYTRWQPELDRHVWLFNKTRAKWVGVVHEEIEVNGKVGKIKNAKLHYQDKTITRFIEKLDKYSELEANILYKKNIKFNFLKAILQIKYNFFVRYIYRLGFLDGWRGFVLSYLMAIYHFQIWIKLWHLQQKTN